MLAAVTFSTDNYKKARKYNVKMAYKKGKADGREKEIQSQSCYNKLCLCHSMGFKLST